MRRTGTILRTALNLPAWYVDGTRCVRRLARDPTALHQRLAGMQDGKATLLAVIALLGPMRISTGSRPQPSRSAVLSCAAASIRISWIPFVAAQKLEGACRLESSAQSLGSATTAGDFTSRFW